MLSNIFVVLLSIIVFIFLTSFFSLGLEKLKKITTLIFIVVVIFNLTIYSLAYLNSKEIYGVLQAVPRSIIITMLSFTGKNDFAGIIKSASWFSNSLFLQFLFWIFNLLAIFVTVSSLFTLFGKNIIQKIRLYFSYIKKIYIFIGVNKMSVEIGYNTSKNKNIIIFYLDDCNDPSLIQKINSFGGIYKNINLDTINNNSNILRYILKIRKQCIFNISALHSNESLNLRLIKCLRTSLLDNKISYSKVKLFLRTHNELDYNPLYTATSDENVYSVELISDSILTTRQLMKVSPPYKSMSFNHSGMATNNFNVLIVGFGKVGQECLLQLIQKGQFIGSNFSALIVDNYQCSFESFKSRYENLLSNYDITFLCIDAFSEKFFNEISLRISNLVYIVLALKSYSQSFDIVSYLDRYLIKNDIKTNANLKVNIVDKEYVSVSMDRIRFSKRYNVLTYENFFREDIDNMAIAVNWNYHKDKIKTLDDVYFQWHVADYFSRESCRSSAEFLYAMLYIAGYKDENNLPTEKDFMLKLNKNTILKDNLAINEHLRWNAFHFCMGYSKMSLEEVHERFNTGTTPIQKDLKKFRHACLVDWSDLDLVSSTVSKLTNNDTLDYKSYDYENIFQIMRTLSYKENLDNNINL